MKKRTIWMRGCRRFFALIFAAAVFLSGGCERTQDTEVRPGADGSDTADVSPKYDWDHSYGEPLVIWGIDPDLERSYMTKAFARYEYLTGNRLELVQVSQEEFDEMMLSAFQGDGPQPDVVLSYGGTNIEPYDPDENFYDFIDAAWVDDLTDTSINQTIYNGRIIGLPHWEASVSGTIYNKEIFEKYGLDIPQTQEEFLDLCQILLDHGVTPLYMPGAAISMLLYQFPMDAVLEDGQVLAGLNDGSLAYADIPQMQQIVQWYKTMAQAGYMGDTWQTNDWGGMSAAMDSGDYAMMLCWDTWLYTDYDGDADRFGLMPAFMGVPENGTFEGPNLGLLMVNRHSERLESALNFITFLADPYNYNVAFEGIYTAPVFKNQIKSISTPQYLEAERLIEHHFRDSTAWLRVRGFSQMDATAILEYMSPECDETALECLEHMDALRNKRLGQ